MTYFTQDTITASVEIEFLTEKSLNEIKNCLNAELTNEFATQISVGAQNNGNTLGVNAGSFAYYNYGLIDRIIPVKKIVENDEKPKSASV